MFNNPTCNGTGIVDRIDECNTRVDGSSQYAFCLPSFANLIVKYHKNSDCSDDGVQFLAENGIFTSTEVGLCTVSFQGQGRFVSMRSFVDGDEVKTTYFEDANCQQKIETVKSKVNKCNKATGFASGTEYKYYTVESYGFYGTINLNEQATKDNRRIAGSSIGVLCGFTVLLILISMTGIFDI